MKRAAFVVCVGLAACGGTTSKGSGTGGGTYPEKVKLQGTIEYAERSYSGGQLLFSKGSKGSFSGTSTASDIGALLHYQFTDPFMVSGTQEAYDVTLNPSDCSKNITTSTRSNLDLYVGSLTSGGYVAALQGYVNASSADTCPSGATNIFDSFSLDLPNDKCPDPAIKVVSNAEWLVPSGDPRTGFDFSQDITCDAAVIKITASVEAL